MKTKNIRQSVTIKASPKEVYEALMDSKKHTKFTHHKAIISREVGGKFSAFRGYCGGVNLELVEGRKIVQENYAVKRKKCRLAWGYRLLVYLHNLIFTALTVQHIQFYGFK